MVSLRNYYSNILEGVEDNHKIKKPNSKNIELPQKDNLSKTP
jgi:hypothetical protein